MEKDKKQLSKEELEKQEQERKNEEERESILMKADELKEETFDFSDQDGKLEIKNEIADMLLEEIDDPEKKYDLYYNALRKVLMRHLPKGDSFKDLRDIIYEEKNTFLTGYRKDQNQRRHADGRMSYSSVMAELVTIVSEWIVSNGTPFELYVRLRDENIKRGYGTAK